MIDGLNIALRFALYADLMLLFGLPLFGLYALGEAERRAGRFVAFRPLIAALSVAAIGLSILGIVVMTASMAGVSLRDVDPSAVTAMITDTSMGHAWGVRMAALALTTLVAIALKGPAARMRLSLATSGAAVALASLAWAGHGAAGEGAVGAIQLIADIIHLGAAGAWIGALAGLAFLLFRPLTSAVEDDIRRTHSAFDSFSTVGTIIVGLIVATGLINGYALVGPRNVLALPLTVYGQVLLAKLALFGAMLGLAGANRYRLTPALHKAIHDGAPERAVGPLRRSLVLEASAAAAILGLVAWLGTLQPPMSS